MTFFFFPILSSFPFDIHIPSSEWHFLGVPGRQPVHMEWGKGGNGFESYNVNCLNEKTSGMRYRVLFTSHRYTMNVSWTHGSN